MLLNEGDSTKVVASPHERRCPEHTSESVVPHKDSIAHAANAGDERHEGSEDGEKSSDDDRFRTMALVEGVRGVKVLSVEETRVLTGEYFRTDKLPDMVVHHISHGGGNTHGEKRCPRADKSSRRERTDGEEERVTREEGGDDEAGLREDNEEQYRIYPMAYVTKNYLEVSVNVKEEMEYLRHRLLAYLIRFLRCATV